MRTTRHLVVGLQESGKTTFAAALWYLLDSGEVPTRLRKGLHEGDYLYLEEITKLWGDGWRVGRTSHDRQEAVRINLVDETSNYSGKLEFTDLSGESFEKLFATRQCDPAFVELVASTDGILLFVSARRKIDDHTILDFMDGAGQLSELEAAATDPDPKFDPAKVPHQVQLVDLLQALVAPPFPRKRLRIAVIVSAWDLSRRNTADEWLQDSMPLLDQYLRGNPETIDFRAYGVSAQGGELPKKEDGPQAMRAEREALLGIATASTRIKVVGHGAGPHDLTSPLYWLGGLESNDEPWRDKTH
jgi:hypothetical protein